MGAWASVDHGHEHVRSVIRAMGRAFLLAGCVPLLILVRRKVAEPWPPADEPLLLEDAHRLGDCLPGMPVLAAQLPDRRESGARGDHAAGDLITQESG